MESPRFSHSGSLTGVGIGGGKNRDFMTNEEINPYWEGLDGKSIPTFLAEFFENGDSNALHEEHVLCLFEVLAKVHGRDIVSQIGYMMDTIIKTLRSSVVVDSLQDACAKLVSGIARFGIQPLMAEDEKREIVYSLYQPLSNCFLGTQEGLVYGSALCMEALVNSVNWRFASDEIVNDVCVKVAVALEEKPTQTKAHMGLVMALAKHNSLRLEPYARVLMRSGLQILSTGVDEGDSQKQLSSIQMMNLLMKCVDPRSVFSELEIVIKELEKCYSFQIQFVRDAAFEAIQTARTLIHEKWSTHEESDSTNDCKYVRRSHCEYKTAQGTKDISHSSASPGSQYVYSVCVCDIWAESRVSTNQPRPKFDFSGSSVKRNLWKEEVDRSLTNGCNGYMDFDDIGSDTDSKPFDDGEIKKSEVDNSIFSGCIHAAPRHGRHGSTMSPRHGRHGSTMSSSERSQSNLDADDNEFFTSQKELCCSHQDPVSKVPKKQVRMIRFRKPSSNELEGSLGGRQYGNHHVSETQEQPEYSKTGSSGSITANLDFEGSHGEKTGYKTTTEHQSVKHKGSVKVGLKLAFGFSMMLLAFMFLYAWIDDQPGLHSFPT